MTAVTRLLMLCDAYGQALGLPETTVSWRVFGDTKKLGAIRAGGDIQTARYEKALAWLDENWPQGAQRPVDGDRQLRAQAEAG